LEMWVLWTSCLFSPRTMIFLSQPPK
jgi:hypothetical protein